MIVYYKKYKTGEYSVMLTDGSGFGLELDCDDLDGAKEVIDTILGNCSGINISSPVIEPQE